MDPPRDVVFTFSTETLADAAARGLARPPERMLQTLEKSPRVRRLLVVDAPRWLPSLLRRGRTAWPEGLGDPRPHLRPWRLRRREAVAPDEVADAVRRREQQIEQAARRNGLSKPSIVTFDPLLAGFATWDWAGPVTFYGRDDWSRFPPRRPWWPAYEAAYSELREQERGVLAISASLLGRIDPTGPAAVVPNGIDPSEWDDPGPAPTWFSDLARPVHIYVGTVDERIDESLIHRLCAERGTVLLVGPCTDDERRGRLSSAGAVLHSTKDRSELVALVAASDTGLIPHCRTELTLAMSPLKLYEYRAAGRPVAAVDLPPIATEAETDPRVVLALDGPEGFVAAVNDAARLGPDSEDDRHDYIGGASWAGRHRAALDIILRP